MYHRKSNFGILLVFVIIGLLIGSVITSKYLIISNDKEPVH